jgi:hypothetical protein
MVQNNFARIRTWSWRKKVRDPGNAKESGHWVEIR